MSKPRVTTAFNKWMRRYDSYITPMVAFRAGIRYQQGISRGQGKIVAEAFARIHSRNLDKKIAFGRLIEELSNKSPAHRAIANRYREYLK